MRCVLVYGPPAAGKTTYVRDHMRLGDIVWDQDAINAALTRGSYDGPEYLRLLLALRNRFLDTVQAGLDVDTVWVIACAPTEAERRELMTGIHYEEVVIDTPLEVCLARLKRQGRAQSAFDYAAQWWRTYQRTWA